MARKILITSALPYVNNVPHLGNMIGAPLSADVYTRFCKSRGYETLFVLGTDEHGTATEVQARKEGITPRQLCDKYFAIHKEIYEWFNISCDVLGRTSDPQHTPITQNIFSTLERNGYIIEQEIEQLYSEADNMFLADRYVLGTCPHCGYEDARGDQCDQCGKLLTPLELRNPRSALSGSTPVVKKTKHLFLDLPQLEPQLREWLSDKQFSDNTMRTTSAWLREGLKPRAITRDLNWGVPVPKPGYEHKVFYVWFDAPIGYISITAGLGKDVERKWWHSGEVELYQFMGKDNILFHSVIFPAVLLGTQESWTLVKHINTTEFLNYEDTKFSKSRGVGVFGDDVKELDLPADVFRYYLLTNRPEQSDTAFTWQDFQSKLNGELVANLGNLVHRTTSFINQYYEGRIPASQLRETDTAFWADVRNEIRRITEELEAVRLKDALHRVMRLSSLGNAFFQRNEPWRARKENPDNAAATIATLANFLIDIAIVIEPFLPDTAKRICEQLGTSLPTWSALTSTDDLLLTGHSILPSSVLFRKIEDEEVAALRERFSGARQKEPAVHQGLKSLKLVVGEITAIERHPNADKLYIEKINLGGEERTIVSGLAQHYTPDQLKGKRVIIVANLLPAKLRGVESEGMLLAAQDESGTVGIVTTQAPPGTLVSAATEARQVSIDDFARVELLSDGEHVLHEKKPLRAGTYELHVERGVRGRVR